MLTHSKNGEYMDDDEINAHLVENYAKLISPDGVDFMISYGVYRKILDHLQFCESDCHYFDVGKSVTESCKGECSMIVDALMYHDFKHELLTKDPMEIKDIRKRAYVFARKAHAGLQDDDGKDYFFAHLIPVYKIINLLAPLDVGLQCAALLHDTIEDTDTTYEDLVQHFGKTIAGLVLEVTHVRTTDDKGWYFPYLKTRRGILLKFADRCSNISRMNTWDVEKQQTYLNKSKFWKSIEQG